MDKENTEKVLLKKITELEAELKKVKKQKKYGLVWEEKPEQIVEDCKHNVPILRLKEKKKGIDPVIVTNHTKDENILIEGDNYHALSVLNYTHKGKIDVIYIDPPYNTGKAKEWKYNDYWVDENDSYRHSRWISFMENRLKIAKNLLSKDGLVLIHIDEHEMPRLLLLCEECFGDNNVDCLVWQKTDAKVDKNTNAKIINRYKSIHEYLIICYLDKMSTRFGKILKLPEWKNKYTNIDNDPRGPYKQGIISFQEGHEKEDRNSVYYYTITLPSGRKMTRHFFVTKEEFEELINDNRIYFPKDGDGVPALKVFENEEKEFFLDSILTGFGTSSTAKEDLRNIFGSELPFETPKPIKLGIEILRVVSKRKSIICDYFAGSGTVGHAVLELNKQDSGDRKFILCTNNENNICEEVTYERIKRVITGYKNKKGEKVEGLDGNLRYYKTDLVNIERLHNAPDQAKINLTYQAGEMIGLKENTLNEVEKNDWWQIFEGNGKTTAIYFKEDKEKLLKLVEILEKKKHPTALYIFSWGKNEYKSEYSSSTIRVEDIPEPILEVYKEINRL